MQSYKDLAYKNPFHEAIQERNLEKLNELINAHDMTSLLNGSVYYGHPLVILVEACWSEGVAALCNALSEKLNFEEKSDKELLDSLDNLRVCTLRKEDEDRELNSSPRRSIISGPELRHELFERAKRNPAVIEILNNFSKEGDTYGKELEDKRQQDQAEKEQRREDGRAKIKSLVQSVISEQKNVFALLNHELKETKEIFSAQEVEHIKSTQRYSKNIAIFFPILARKMNISERELADKFLLVAHAQENDKMHCMQMLKNNNQQPEKWESAARYSSTVGKNIKLLMDLRCAISEKPFHNFPMKYNFLEQGKADFQEIIQYIKMNNFPVILKENKEEQKKESGTWAKLVTVTKPLAQNPPLKHEQKKQPQKKLANNNAPITILPESKKSIVTVSSSTVVSKINHKPIRSSASNNIVSNPFDILDAEESSSSNIEEKRMPTTKKRRVPKPEVAIQSEPPAIVRVEQQPLQRNGFFSRAATASYALTNILCDGIRRLCPKNKS